MSDVPVLPSVDTEPDEWVEHDDLHMTPAELAEGNRLGETIDADDDDDDAGLP